MELEAYKKNIPSKIYAFLEPRITTLRPAQYKSIDKGLFEGRHLLVCTPTASGKTLVGELAILNAILHDKGKCVYIVPLRALASEKHKEFKERYPFKTGLSSGDMDSADPRLAQYDLIVTTSEKFDSLMRHKASWIPDVKVVVIDEIHLLNDPGRGPTLEMVITLLRHRLPEVQIIGLSATIGNPEELADWLDAALVKDSWRPVRLDQGVYREGKIHFY